MKPFEIYNLNVVVFFPQTCYFYDCTQLLLTIYYTDLCLREKKKKIKRRKIDTDRWKEKGIQKTKKRKDTEKRNNLFFLL